MSSIARGSVDLHDLEDFSLDDVILDYVSRWPKDSVAHRFARYVAHGMFTNDTSGPYIETRRWDDSGRIVRERFLPVDVGIQLYEFDHEPFLIPESDGSWEQQKPNVCVWRESHKVANACYDYFTNDLMHTQAYDDLLGQMADEVFHIMFQNRAAMAGLNMFLASIVRDLEVESLDDDVVRLFQSDGRLKRVPVPRWVRRAVFFRDHGRCTGCGSDLSNLLDTLPASQFDHIVPLAQGGLNDITNMQLLCESCNGKKSATTVAPGSNYRRWYDH